MALRRWQMQADLHEFDPSLVYRVASRTSRAALKKPCPETSNKKKNKKGGGGEEKTTMYINKVLEPSSS